MLLLMLTGAAAAAAISLFPFHSSQLLESLRCRSAPNHIEHYYYIVRAVLSRMLSERFLTAA